MTEDIRCMLTRLTDVLVGLAHTGVTAINSKAD